MRKLSPNKVPCGESPGPIRRPPGVRLGGLPARACGLSFRAREGGHESKDRATRSPGPAASFKWLLRSRYQTCESRTQSRSWRVLNGNKETVILQ